MNSIQKRKVLKRHIKNKELLDLVCGYMDKFPITSPIMKRKFPGIMFDIFDFSKTREGREYWADLFDFMDLYSYDYKYVYDWRLIKDWLSELPDYIYDEIRANSVVTLDSPVYNSLKAVDLRTAIIIAVGCDITNPSNDIKKCIKFNRPINDFDT